VSTPYHIFYKLLRMSTAAADAAANPWSKIVDHLETTYKSIKS